MLGIGPHGLMDSGELAQMNSSGIWHCFCSFFPDFFLEEKWRAKVRSESKFKSWAGTGWESLCVFLVISLRRRRGMLLWIFWLGERACWWTCLVPALHEILLRSGVVLTVSGDQRLRTNNPTTLLMVRDMAPSNIPSTQTGQELYYKSIMSWLCIQEWENCVLHYGSSCE